MTTATAPHTCADCQQPATNNEGVTWWRLNTDRRSVRLVAVCRECAQKRDAAKGAQQV